MPSINFKAPITDLDGKQVDGATLGSVCTAALLAPNQQDSAETKGKLFDLALAIHGKEAADLKVEDVAMLKERVGKCYPPLVVGRTWQLLDPQP